MIDVRRLRSVVIALAVVFILLLGNSGCGTDEAEVKEEDEEQVEEEERIEEESIEEEAKEGEEEVKEEEYLAVAIDDWRNPTGVSEIVDNFEKMVWTWASIEDGEEVRSEEVSYQNMGSETVDGVDTELLSFSIDDQELKVWADGTGEIVQAEAEGQIIPGELVDQALEGLVGAIFWPFWTFEEYGIHDALVESTPGVEWSVISIESEQFGDATAEVTHLEVDVGPPFTPEGVEGTANWSVGDFDDYQMLVEWGWSEITAEGDSTVEYNLKEVVPY